MRYPFPTMLVLCACVQQEDSTESAIVAVEPGVSEGDNVVIWRRSLGSHTLQKAGAARSTKVKCVK